MRIPRTAPDTQTLERELFSNSPSRIWEVLGAAPEPTVRGKYLHWDELRHRDPPSGFTHEEWWLALKWHRRGPAKKFPLRSASGKPFSFSLVDPLPQGLHEIDLGAGGQIGMPDPIANPDTRDQYYVRSLIQEAITSSQLEGATTTRQVAKEMIRTGREPQDRSERMILNNFFTMRRIGELKSEEVSKELVFELHRSVTDGALDDPSAAGRFRRPTERVVVEGDRGEIVHVPPAAEQLEERMAAMCAFANGDDGDGFVHPVIRSILLHFWLAYDHPFVDGNGRTARALFYWSMLRNGYWLFEFISISETILQAPARYSLAFLHTETDDRDATYFLLYHLDVIQRAIRGLHAFIDQRSRELAAVERDLRGLAALNHRQRALVSHALRHPNAEYTIRGHSTNHAVVYQTARTDLLDLERRGLLGSSKRGRTSYFRPVPELHERLQSLA